MVRPLALALLVVSGQGWRASTAPGPSSRAHQPFEGNCDGCHLPFKGLPNEKCLSCHGKLQRFHAGVAAKKCVSCHTEHKGPAADLTRPAARASFDHALTRLPLVGAHQQVPCGKCHTRPLGQLGGSCSSCHGDPHQAALGAACSACHDSRAWKPPLHPRAEHALSLAGGHAKAQCAACHAKGENLGPSAPCSACHPEAHGGTTASCAGCHDVRGWTPARFDHAFCTCILPRKHQTVGCLGCHREWNFTRTPTLCSGCHEQQRKHEPLGECSLCHSGVSWKKNRFDHNQRAKLRLSGEHLKVACESCHPAAGAALKFRGVPERCEGCHQQQGDAAHGSFGPCGKCHASDGFKPSPFDHASTGFSLAGKHLTLGCKGCHAEKTRGYPAGEAGCSHCHADPHQGSPAPDGECAACHTSEAWKPTTFTVERHAATAFPLTGSHVRRACSRCHFEPKLNDVSKECGGCHLDRHEGKLGRGCEKCHRTTAFTPVVGFDHAVTGFALAGRHAKVTCESCHDGKRGEALAAAAAPVACTTCHRARHGPELGADCRACHDPAAGPFSKARGMTFAHQRTGFPLERRHLTVACGACHKAEGPPPSPACGGCHADPHSGQLGQGCADCHLPDRFRLVRFDHDRTGWPLRGRHFVAPCVSCHTAQRWVGLTDDCWDCHAVDAARGKARAPASHPFGPLDCSNCHASRWRW